VCKSQLKIFNCGTQFNKSFFHPPPPKKQAILKNNFYVDPPILEFVVK
jgi:hypothetical protein